MFFLELVFGLNSLYRNLLSLEFFNSNEVPGLPFCSLIRIIQDFIQDTEDGLTVRKRSVIYNKLKCFYVILFEIVGKRCLAFGSRRGSRLPAIKAFDS
jgi:hypothetical protein